MCIGDTYKTQKEDFLTRLVRVQSTCGVAKPRADRYKICSSSGCLLDVTVCFLQAPCTGCAASDETSVVVLLGSCPNFCMGVSPSLWWCIKNSEVGTLLLLRSLISALPSEV